MTRRQSNSLVSAAIGLALVAGWAIASAQPRAQRTIDWVAVSPEFDGATYVNDPSTCQACHEDVMATYAHTTHARAFDLSSSPEGQCETCHGPRSKHVENPTDVLAFADLPSRTQSAVCLQCHEGGGRMGWKAGAHQASDVSCASCHQVMEVRSERALLVQASASATCYTCHTDIRGDMNKMSHHPVREGKMECASCHNTHGATPGLLVKATINDTCYTCHADKRGPFLWEHAPVRESCANCHTPHGSNHRTLLTSKDPFQCLSCHSYGGHINLPRYNRTSNPYGQGCSNCHITPHGSNHPSGAKLTR